ncbi:MAG: OmpA family protein [Deltaproteobacteria bacterium]|nr:OmpA family protein [Deltaproteobacteria bacterium]
MRKKMWIFLTLLVVIPGLLFTVSCKQKPAPVDTAALEAQAAAKAEAEKRTEMERQTRLAEEQRLREEALKEEARLQAEREIAEAREKFLSVDIRFEFDSAALTLDSQMLLKEKAQWLKDNSDARAVIEGHCDERGTNEYNLALGDRRAESTKAFLVDLGLDGLRLNTISYGEEQPLDPGHDEMAWAQNRRAHFSLK